jgi:hypothetical protein
MYLCANKKTKTMTTESKKIEQMNTYQVVYSDGVRILDYVYASNLNEAKKIAAENAKTKNYGTAYYKVARCYNGGVRGSSNQTHWH